MLNSFYTENICQKRLLFCFSSPFLPEQTAYLYTFLSFHDGGTPLYIASFQGHSLSLSLSLSCSQNIENTELSLPVRFCFVHWTMLLYRSIDCPSKDCNTFEAMNGCVYFTRKLSSAGVILSFVGCACVGGVQVSITQNRIIWCLITHITSKQEHKRFHHWHCVLV